MWEIKWFWPNAYQPIKRFFLHQHEYSLLNHQRVKLTTNQKSGVVLIYWFVLGILSSIGATIELKKDRNRDDNLLFGEGGTRIIFSIDNMKEKEWLNHLNNIQVNLQSSVYIKKIGYVSGKTLNIKIQEKNICNIRVDELTKTFNNSISGHF